MSSFKVVSVKKVQVSLSPSNDSNNVVTLIPTSININYNLGSLPICSLTLVGGTALDGSVSNTTNVEYAFYLCNNYRCTLDVKLDVQTIDNAGKTSEIREITIFSGITTSSSIQANTSAHGKSSLSIAITAYHQFAELYQYGANGMVYEQPSTIKYNSSISTLLKNMEADTKHKASSSTVNNANIVAGVRDKYTKVSSGSSRSNTNAPIVTVLNDLIARMSKAGILDKDLDITKYITGSVYPNLAPGFVRSFTSTYLNNIWRNVSSGSVGSAILTMATSNGHILTIAPRDPHTITLLPMDGFTIYLGENGDSKPPTITYDMYHAINYNMPKDIKPVAEGVLVTKSGSRYNGNGAGSGVIIGKYPDKGDDKIRWKYVSAPSWLIDKSMYESSAKDNSKATDSVEYRDICNTYARYIHNSIINSNNGIILSMDARSIEAYRALGSVVLLDTGYYGTIQGLLSSYTFQYRSSVAGSAMDVQVYLSHVKQYNEEEAKKSSSVGKRVFELDKTDIITKFPDISNVDSE